MSTPGYVYTPNGDGPYYGPGYISSCGNSKCYNGTYSNCYNCSPCNSCNQCNGGCNSCYSKCNSGICHGCNQCDSCQTCVECQGCVSCQSCNSECHEENSGYDNVCGVWYAGSRSLNRNGQNCRPGYTSCSTGEAH